MQPRRKSSQFSILRRRMEACDLRNPNRDQLVDYLCNKYPDYSRSKRRWLSKQVSNFLLESSCRKSTSIGSSVSDLVSAAEEENDGPKRKKAKKSDTDDGEEEEDGMSTSGEYEPEFDLLNSQLRKRYVTSVKTGKDENAVVETELMGKEAGSALPKSKAELLKDGGGRGSGARPAMVKKGVDGSETGPMLRDLGGMRSVLNELFIEVIVPLRHPELPQRLGVKPTTGILLHGPPGCGKTNLAHAIANQTGVPFYEISASGASEENIEEVFRKAYRTAPSIVFIDEIDVIGSKKEDLQRQTDRRIVNQLMNCMDQSRRPKKPEAGLENSDSSPGHVLVIGATNRPHAVEPALRRPGRFDREIVLGVPDESARSQILSVLTCHLRVVGTFDLQKIARATPGYVGADLAALVGKAGLLAIKRIMDHRVENWCEQDWWEQDWWEQPVSCEEMERAIFTMEDFENAVGEVQPSSKREGFSAIPSEKWEDVGGLQELRQVFEDEIINRIKFPKVYESRRIKSNSGFLLYGPPGCGKTLIAKAVANEAGANFIHIRGPEIMNKYVGESELAVRTMFSRARTCAPCILFFDEVDALTSRRGNEGGSVVDGLVNQLLVELSEKRKDVYVIGATNRPEAMDGSFLRPGRFGTPLYVPLPSPHERGVILTVLAKDMPIDPSVDLMAIGSDDSCENFSGADLSEMMHKAAMASVREELASGDSTRGTITESHFKHGISKTTSSLTDKQRRHFMRLSKRFKAS